MNANLLKAKMAEHGLTQKETAKRIGISYSRFNAKVTGCHGAEFTLADVNALKEALKLDAAQIDAIFFA